MRLTATGVHKQREILLEISYDPTSGGYFLLVHYVGTEKASDFWYVALDDALGQAEEDFGVGRDRWETTG